MAHQSVLGKNIMNAGSLWAGTEYAWAEYRPRGSFPMGAMKVKVIKVQKVYNYGPNKATVVDVEILEGRYEGTMRQVKARDIVNFWNEYEDERNHRREQREQFERERQERVNAIRNERAELERKEAEENQKIADALRERGLLDEGIKSLGSSIILDRALVISWLGIDVH